MTYEDQVKAEERDELAADNLRLRKALNLVLDQEAGKGEFVPYEDVLRHMKQALDNPPSQRAEALRQMVEALEWYEKSVHAGAPNLAHRALAVWRREK